MMINRLNSRLAFMAFLSLLWILFLAGCGKNAGVLDKKEREHPYLKKAKSRLAAQDVNGAIEYYKKALLTNPLLAKAHLDLGLIYDEHKEDYIESIYHYKRYLELRPDSQKKALIEDAIRHANLLYAASQPNRPSEAVQLIAQLRKEIEELKVRNKTVVKELEKLRLKQNMAGNKASKSSNALSAASEKSSASGKPSRYYVVRAGDNLTRIAEYMYGPGGDPNKIFQANKNIIKNKNRLKVGQKLIIP